MHTLLTDELFSFNTNSWRMCFWLVCYCLNSPELLASLRHEISLASGRAMSLPALHKELTACVLLKSVYHEVLRLVDSPISLRELIAPATSALGEPLPKGATLLLAHRQLLTSDKAWGPNPLQLNATRFIKDETLLRSKSYTPFGGGSMLCPGRFMSRSETLVFLALFIQRFNITPQTNFPRLDTKSGAGAGILGIKEGDDYILLLSAKGTEQMQG